MGLNLYAHNAKAYKSALAMMQQYGKAAIVHPTGTGKSYIAFKLIEDHPEVAILWLSPSEYIFKTQLDKPENAGCEFIACKRYFLYLRKTDVLHRRSVGRDSSAASGLYNPG